LYAQDGQDNRKTGNEVRTAAMVLSLSVKGTNMPNQEHEMHFGLNCRLLMRDPYSPADLRCSAAIERYSDTKFRFLDTTTAVPVTAAARFLGLSEAEVLRRAKAGDLEYTYPDNVSRRIVLFTKKGKREFTITEAAKRMNTSPTALEARIQAGELEAFYPDTFMQIILVNRWEYEKCPLIETGGRCYDFQPHEGPYIRCMADAARLPRDNSCIS
jgi:hypothetical protein